MYNYGYNCYTPCYSGAACGGTGCGFAFILVLFILLAIICSCGGFGFGSGCGCQSSLLAKVTDRLQCGGPPYGGLINRPLKEKISFS